MSDKHHFTGAQVVPLPYIPITNIKQDDTIILITTEQLDQWVPIIATNN